MASRCALFVLVMGCAGGHRAAPAAAPPPRTACPSLPVPTGEVAYGVVTDAVGAPIAGAKVRSTRYAYHHGNWQVLPNNETTTARDGSYRVPLVMADVLEIDAAGRRVVWTQLAGAGPRRIDVVIDLARPAGVVGIFDASRHVTSRCEAWRCPADRAPGDAWWTDAQPCPAGSKLDLGVGTLQAVIIARCVTADGTLHGPFTSWQMPEDHSGWVFSKGWFDRGTRCGQWVE